MALGPSVAARWYGGAAGWGAVLTAYGLGAVAGELLALKVRPSRPMVAATLATMAWSLAVGALALLLPLPWVALAAALTGGGMAFFIVLWYTAMQREVRPDALSRVASYDSLGSLLLQPAGYAMVGPLSGAIGLAGVLWLACGWQFVSSLGVLAVPGVRKLRG